LDIKIKCTFNGEQSENIYPVAFIMLKIRKEIVMEKFTNKELKIISNGLISLIVNAAKAKGLVTDTVSLGENEQ